MAKKKSKTLKKKSKSKRINPTTKYGSRKSVADKEMVGVLDVDLVRSLNNSIAPHERTEVLLVQVIRLLKKGK